MARCDEKIVVNDILFRDYWDRVYSYLSDRMCDAHNFEIFGNQAGSTEQYDMMNDIFYMYLYGYIAYYEQQQLFKKQFPEAPGQCPDKISVMRDIWDKFGFECKADYFRCKHHIDLHDLLMRVFGLGTDMGKGIDYMRIENTDDCIPPFKIK